MTDRTSVGHNCMLVHGHVASLYRESFKKSQDGQIGIALVRPLPSSVINLALCVYTDFKQNMEWVEPVDESPQAVQAACLATERCIGWVRPLDSKCAYYKLIVFLTIKLAKPICMSSASVR